MRQRFVQPAHGLDGHLHGQELLAEMLFLRGQQLGGVTTLQRGECLRVGEHPGLVSLAQVSATYSSDGDETRSIARRARAATRPAR